MELFIQQEVMNTHNWVEKDARQCQVQAAETKNVWAIDHCFSVEKVILPQNDDGAQVACGQHFSLCLTVNGKIVIWGSLSGKTTNDDGMFYARPE